MSCHTTSPAHSPVIPKCAQLATFSPALSHASIIYRIALELQKNVSNGFLHFSQYDVNAKLLQSRVSFGMQSATKKKCTQTSVHKLHRKFIDVKGQFLRNVVSSLRSVTYNLSFILMAVVVITLCHNWLKIKSLIRLSGLKQAPAFFRTFAAFLCCP